MSKHQKFFKTPDLRHAHYLTFLQEQSAVPVPISTLFSEFQESHPNCQQNSIPQIQQFLIQEDQPQKNNQSANQEIIQSPIKPNKPDQSEFIHQQMSEIMATPPKRDQKRLQEQTTISKKYQLRMNWSERTIRFDVRDHEWTLRNLAKLAYDAVVKIGPTSYRQVANEIIQEKIENGQNLDEKQQRNIGRRVYDALNVLIALGKLEKQGRKIFRDPKKMEVQESREHQRYQYQTQIQNKQNIIHQIKNIKNKHAKALKNLRYLTNRNRHLFNRNAQDPERIGFPLIGLPLEQIKTVRKTSHNIKLASYPEQSFSVMGDLDCLALLNLNGSQ